MNYDLNLKNENLKDLYRIYQKTLQNLKLRIKFLILRQYLYCGN